MDKTTNLRRKEPLPSFVEKKKLHKKLPPPPPIDLSKSYIDLPGPSDSDRFEEFDALFVDDAQNCDYGDSSFSSTSVPINPFPTPTNGVNNMIEEEVIFPKPIQPAFTKGAKGLFEGTKFDIPYDPSEKLVESPIYRNEPTLDDDFIELTRNETKRYALHRQEFLDKSQSALDDLATKYPDYREQITSWYNMIVDTAGKARYDLKARLIALRSCTFQFGVSPHIRNAIKDEIDVLSDFLGNFDVLERERIQLMVWGAKLYAVWDGINSLLY